MNKTYSFHEPSTNSPYSLQMYANYLALRNINKKKTRADAFFIRFTSFMFYGKNSRPLQECYLRQKMHRSTTWRALWFVSVWTTVQISTHCGAFFEEQGSHYRHCFKDLYPLPNTRGDDEKSVKNFAVSVVLYNFAADTR